MAWQDVEKLPVKVKAIEWDARDTTYEAIQQQSGGRLVMRDELNLYIDTLEGEMTARLGDMVMRGVNGELYPCKPDVFAKTYKVL